jgi:CheY-like chemotaxis protein
MNFSFREMNWDDNIKLMDSAAQMLQYLEALIHTKSCPSLILINSNLQLISCEEVMAYLKSNSQYQNIPIVVYSTDMNETLSNRLTALGAYSCHKKPADKLESKQLAEYLKCLTINEFNQNYYHEPAGIQ